MSIQPKVINYLTDGSLGSKLEKLVHISAPGEFVRVAANCWTGSVDSEQFAVVSV